MTRAAIFHIPTLAGAGSNYELGAVNSADKETAEDIPLAPFAAIESSEVTRGEPLSGEAFSSLCTFPEFFRHDAPFRNVDPLPIALRTRSAGLSTCLRLRSFWVRFQTNTPRYRSLRSISKIDDTHHALTCRVLGGFGAGTPSAFNLLEIVA